MTHKDYMKSKFQFQNNWDIAIFICLHVLYDYFHAMIAVLDTASDIARPTKYKYLHIHILKESWPTLVLGHDIHLAQWAPAFGRRNHLFHWKEGRIRHPLWHISTLGCPMQKEMVIPTSDVVDKGAIPFHFPVSYFPFT